MKPLVSILCITYNHEQFIEQTLDSFLMQKTSFDFEIVIHDDASTDATQSIIRKYAIAHPGTFKLTLEQKNQYSQGSLQFIGDMYQSSLGNYVAVCEGDDYWTDPHKLQKQVDLMIAHPQYALSFHRVKVLTEGDPTKDLIFPDPHDARSFDVKGLLERNFIQTNTVMYRRQDYSKIPEHVLPLDWYMHLYHAQFGEIGFIDEVMSVYRRHPGGMWWDTDRNIDEIWRKFGLSHLALYEAMMKLYGQVPENRKIISDSIIAMYKNLVGVDDRYGEKLLKQAIHRFPESTLIYINFLAGELTRATARQGFIQESKDSTASVSLYGVRRAGKELLRAVKRSAKSRLGR